MQATFPTELISIVLDKMQLKNSEEISKLQNDQSAGLYSKLNRLILDETTSAKIHTRVSLLRAFVFRYGIKGWEKTRYHRCLFARVVEDSNKNTLPKRRRNDVQHE